jgi:hypothetical protein
MQGIDSSLLVEDLEVFVLLHELNHLSFFTKCKLACRMGWDSIVTKKRVSGTPNTYVSLPCLNLRLKKGISSLLVNPLSNCA